MTKLKVQRAISVPREIDDCYHYLVDFSTCEQWDPGVYRAEKTTPGQVTEGTRFRVELDAPLGKIEMEYRLKKAVFPTKILLSGEGRGFTVQDQIELQSLPEGGTRIRYTAMMDLQWLPKAFRPVARKWVDRIGDKAMDGLKASLLDEIQLPDEVEPSMAQKLVLPAALDFTKRGYLSMPHAGLTRRMDGKTVVITGPTGGLGLAAAKELARLGARLVLLGRDHKKLASAVADINAFAGFTEIDVYEADLSLIQDCKQACERILELYPSIDVLINNAGALPNQRQETVEGHELSLAINLLAPAVITHALLPAIASAQGRVINVVSGGLYLQPLNLRDIQFSEREYDGAEAYAQAKRATLILTDMLASSPAADDVAFHAMHPGWAATPGVAKSLPAFNRLVGPWLRDARMGADTAVWLASHPELGAKDYPGQFWFDRQLVPYDVLAHTRVSESQRRALADWLSRTCDIEPPVFLKDAA